MQFFAALQEFDVFEEFNGEKGKYLKSFLISDKVNLNDWQATHEANIMNLDDAIGRPGIHYINAEGKRDHTGATTKKKSLQIQELYRAASILAVGSDMATRRMWQVSKIINNKVAKLIEAGEIKFISPSIWPKENAVELIPKTDGGETSIVHDYDWLHYAFVDEPAYGDEASIKSFCDGTSKDCMLELSKFNASISEIEPLVEHKIKIPDTSKKSQNTSDKTNSNNSKTMATEEELQKQLQESKKALKAAEEELQKLKEKEAKRAQEEEEPEEEKTSKKSKKAEEVEEDKEKVAMKARIEVLEKEPLVEKIVTSQLAAGIITQEQVPSTTQSFMTASKDELNRTLLTSQSFEAKLKTFSPGISTPYMGSNAGSFDASFDDMDSETLLMEVSEN